MKIFISFLLIIKALSFTNYVSNPSFEIAAGTNSGAKDFYADTGGCWIDSSTSHTGKNSLHCSRPNTNVYQILPKIIFGIKYRLTVWIKLRNIKNARFIAAADSSDYKYGLYASHLDVKECKSGTCDDKFYKLQYDSLMNFNKAPRYQIAFLIKSDGANPTGEFWIDDITFEPLYTITLNTVEVVTWKQEIFEDPVDIIADVEIIDSVYYNGDYINMTIYIEDEQSRKVMQIIKDHTFDTILEDIRVARFKWDPKSLPKDRFYIVRANLINTLFDNKEENVETTVKKLKNKIDYSFYVDKHLIAWDKGKKFFPLGLYFPYTYEDDLERLKNSPFNVIKSAITEPDRINYVYEKTNKRVRVINNLGFAAEYCMTPECLEKARKKTLEQINKYKDLEGFLGYYIYDEPEDHEKLTRNLREITLTIREYDPNHISWIAINRRLYLNKFKEAFDVVGLDCYPLQYYEALEDIYVVTMQGRKLMINNKPQWDIPQIFDWQRMDETKTNEFPPTESQLKQMIQQFIAGGATGLIFFDYSDMKAMDHKNPFEKEWQKVLTVVNEFKEKYVNIILSRTKPNPNYILPKFDNLNGKNYFGRRIFRYKHYDYVLIVNVRNAPNEWTIYKPSTTSTLENYGSNEKIDIKINTQTNEVKLKMPKASYIWLKGKDSEWNPPEDNDKPDWNGEDDDEGETNILVAVLVPISIVIVIGVGIGIFFYFKKCRKSDEKLENEVKNINSGLIKGNK